MKTDEPAVIPGSLPAAPTAAAAAAPPGSARWPGPRRGADPRRLAAVSAARPSCTAAGLRHLWTHRLLIRQLELAM